MNDKKKLELIQVALEMQKELMQKYYGTPDCKNCSLAEVIQDILDEDNDE